MIDQITPPHKHKYLSVQAVKFLKSNLILSIDFDFNIGLP